MYLTMLYHFYFIEFGLVGENIAKNIKFCELQYKKIKYFKNS